MESTPDVLEQVPAGGGMNKPESGTYGEKTELAALQQALPEAEPAAPQPEPQPVPAQTGGGVAVPPPGLPRGLMAPTNRPDVPVATPLSAPAADPMGGAATDRERRMRYLEILCYDPRVSPELREWAENLKRKIQARG